MRKTEKVSTGGKRGMKTKELLAELITLPVEERVMVVDSLLKSLNTPDSEIDKKWATIAQKRLEQLRSGEVKSVPGEEVFQKVWNRFSK